MLIVLRNFWRAERGYALLVTMTFLAVSVVLLASIMNWTSNETATTARNNLYNVSVSAAEAATEMVIAQMDRDFIYQSVSTDLSQYRNLVPNAIQAGWPTQFRFSDGAGNTDETGVASLGPAVVTNLDSQFAGLYGLVSPYQITSQAQVNNRLYPVSAAVSQSVQFACIPIFQFAIFYGVDLEINPGAPMVVTGKVHSNANLYSAPPASLEFKDDVTAVGQIIPHRDPNDPQSDGAAIPVFDKEHVDQISSLTLPIGIQGNSPVSVQQVLDPPPSSGDTNAALAKQRFYNQADLVVTTTSTGVQVTTGAWSNFAYIPPDTTNAGSPSYSFLNTGASFYDYREGKPTVTTEIDVGKFNAWLANPLKGGSINTHSLGHNLDSIYVEDMRNVSGQLTAVRVTDGSVLPPDGLTVATDLPLYVKGNYNLNNGDTTPGQTDTSKTRPAALVGDAITILSGNWSDGYTSATSLSSRTPVNTTVNAAFIGGIVESATVGNTKHYSGGVENFPRFMENWSSSTPLTYNGSMVVLFPSQHATNFWQNTGVYYNAPKRLWAFDVNFLKQSGLPPCTPQVRKLVRGQWSVIASSN